MPATTDTTADNLLITLMLTPDGRADPYPLYRELRETAPVLRSALGPMVLSRHADCLGALRNPKLGRGSALREEESGVSPLSLGFDVDPELRAAFFDQSADNMLFADPPDHTRLRGLSSRAFTPGRVEAMRPSIQAMVDGVLDRVADKGDVDVMTELAFPLPVRVIGEFVGVPPEDRAQFQPLVRVSAAALEPTADADTLRTALSAQEEMRRYFRGLLADRRRQPQDDFLSVLAEATESDDALTDEEIVATSILLFAAGFETTTNLIGNGLLALLRAPEQLDRWRQDPGLAHTGVEELLRWDSPVQVNLRTALQPVEVAGESLEPGDIVLVLQGGANRDPDRFDHAETLDVGRADNQPLSFGWGIHHCLGAPLARLEGEIVFNSLFERFGSIELLDDSPEWRPNLTLRGLAALPVRFS